MGEYIASVLIISVISFALKELLSGTRISSYVGFISGICIFFVAIMPFFSLISGMRDLSFEMPFAENENESEYESIFSSYVENAEIDLIKREIRSMVAKEFSLDESEIKINIKYDSKSEIKLKRVTVTLLGNAVFANSNEIQDYLERRLSLEVVVLVGG